MPASRALVLLALAALWSGGCGTIRNLTSDDPHPGGGLEKDAEYFSHWHAPSSSTASGTGGAIGCAVALGILPAEMCATAVGDTLTAPFLCWRRGEEWPPKAPSPEDLLDAPVQFTAGASACSE